MTKIKLKMKMSHYILLLISVMISACGSMNNSFKEHPSGLLYRFMEMNPSGLTPTTGDILVLSFSVYTSGGRLLESNDYYRLQLGTPLYKGDFFTGLGMIQVGDSAAFSLDAGSYYEKTRKRELPAEFKAGDPVIIHLRLKDILSQEELEQERLGIYHKDETQELLLLQDYLRIANITETPGESGVYRVIKVKGTGKMAQPGHSLKVHYTGTTIDGKVFDSSLQRNNPISFVLGAGQVIPGWDEAFNGMEEGTVAKLIIPSKMAYGKDGYQNIILPFSTLVFDVELIEVK